MVWLRLLRVFGYVWLVLVGLVILFSLVVIGVREGFWAMASMLSPFNLLNWLITVLALSPGIIALIVVGKLMTKLPLRQ